MSNIRSLMLTFMKEQFAITGDINQSSRYGNIFYKTVTKEEDPHKAKWLKKKIAKNELKMFDVDRLDELSDEEFFSAYTRFMIRFSAWM